MTDNKLSDMFSMVPGYHGCYLRIDLTTGSAEQIPLDEALLRQFLGGSGLGVAILLNERTADVDPFLLPRRWRLSSARWSAAR